MHNSVDLSRHRHLPIINSIFFRYRFSLFRISSRYVNVVLHQALFQRALYSRYYRYRPLVSVKLPRILGFRLADSIFTTLVLVVDYASGFTCSRSTASDATSPASGEEFLNAFAHTLT